MTNKQTQPDKEFDSNYDEGYRHFESGYYWDDENHIGIIFVSQKIVDKYKLDDSGDVELIAQFFDDYDWEDEDRAEYKNYSHYIYISHCAYRTKTKEDNDYLYTSPYGDLGSKEFVMWWNDLPLELMKEPETDVYVFGWCDG